MKILAFDTANNSASVAISRDQLILAYVEEPRAAMQAERILPMIEEALTSAGLCYSDIDYLALTNGPGSFTGIRIGLSVAKGILVSTNIQGAIVTNFEYSYFRAAAQVPHYQKMFVLLNAYRGQLYSQTFTMDGAASPPRLLSYDHVTSLIEQEEKNIVCTGNGVELIYEKIKNIKNVIVLPRFAKVKALHICRYIADKIATKQPLSSNIEPLYIRPPDAKLIKK